MEVRVQAGNPITSCLCFGAKRSGWAERIGPAGIPNRPPGTRTLASARCETPGDGVIIFRGMQDHTAESIKLVQPCCGCASAAG